MKSKGKVVKFDSEAAHAAVVMKDEAVMLEHQDSRHIGVVETNDRGGKQGWYTVDMLEADIDAINADLKPIRMDRGRRYGGQEDTLRNVRECDPEGSWRGAYCSAVECINRLKNIFMTPAEDQNIDDFENMTEDLINYAYYIKILGRQKFNGGMV